MEVQTDPLNPWDITPTEAIVIQRRLAAQVRCEPLTVPVETIAGVDASVRGDRVQTAIVVVRLPSFGVVEEVVWRGPVSYPYISGLLSFREMPAILPALERLQAWPDVFMTDSQGVAHPRRFGLACHLGVWLDRPVFGVAKSRLVGAHEEPGIEKGSRTPLRHKGEHIGAVVRTRTGVKPVYVSIGHRITLEEAVAVTLLCSPQFRIPVPTRLAHFLSKQP